MATWKKENVVITDLGIEILSKLAVGQDKITLVQAVAGAGRVNPSDLHSQTSVPDVRQSLDITNLTFEGGKSIVTLQLSNEFLETEYPVTIIGVYATHPSIDGSFLYLIAQCEQDGKEDNIPLFEDTPIVITYNFELLHSTEANVQIVLDKGAYLTREEFLRHVENYNNPHKVYFTQLVDYPYWSDLINKKANQSDLEKLQDEVKNLSDKITTDIESNPFTITFETIAGVEVTGYWNREEARVEC